MSDNLGTWGFVLTERTHKTIMVYIDEDITVTVDKNIDRTNKY